MNEKVEINYNGIDISHRQGDVDFEKVKEKVDFIIIKAGEGTTYRDPKFIRNFKECERLGIKYGVYWFCNAFSRAKAESEANACVKYLKDNNVNPVIGVFYDIESKPAHINTPKTLLEINHEWVRAMKAAGYLPGIYASKSLFDSKLYSKYYDENMIKWVAQWYVNQPTYNKPFAIWQWTSKGRMDGIDGDVDVDRTMFLIGPNVPKPIEKTQGEKNNIVDRIIAGEFGNGHDVRRPKIEALGFDYDEIRDLVNKKVNMKPEFTQKDYENIAKRVIRGDFGNGHNVRKPKIEALGYDYERVKTLVNKML